MGEARVSKQGMEMEKTKRNGIPNMFDPALSTFVGLSEKLHDCLKSQLKRLVAEKQGMNLIDSSWRKEKGSVSSLGIDLDKQLQPWRENPTWIDEPPVIKVSIPKGSLCNLNVEIDAGLPPDAVYNVVIDPDNKRVFKNIKEVISRRVLVDEGLRQVVEVEQAALWKFLWWSGTISVHVLVDQNRADHSMKFKQVKTGFMKKFEGCWRVEPLFVDEQLCDGVKPKTLKEYQACTGGKGRIGSRVRLEQLIQPAIVPPPPISWYLRGITAKTTEMLINDLLAETARIRGGFASPSDSSNLLQDSDSLNEKQMAQKPHDIKERWAARSRRRNAARRERQRKSL